MRHALYELRLALIALQFLTRVPIPTWVGYRAEWLNACARHFPLVGLGVGAFAALVFVAALGLWPLPVAVLLSMASTLILTGAFHEDGLADTFDALGGAVVRERALEIMKDSRLGTYGTAALVVVLALKAAALLALGAQAAVALLLAHTASRATPVLLIRLLPYAGDAQAAKAKPLAQQVSWAGVVVACGWALAVALVLTYLGTLRTADAGAALLACAGVALLMALWLQRRLGGYTGDTLGATQQLAELGVYLALAARWL